MATGKDILAAAAEELGYREGENRRNKYGAWFGLDGAPWCMEFVQWTYHVCGADLPFKTASCGELLRWYRRNQPECVASAPVPGCIVIFDFKGTKYDTDHTGLFESKTADAITTIDGNTSNGSDGDGGYVQRRTRALDYARPIYIIPRELEEEMKRYQTLEEIKKDAAYAAPTVEKLLKKDFLRGNGAGLDLTADMLRVLVVNDRAGLYE